MVDAAVVEEGVVGTIVAVVAVAVAVGVVAAFDATVGVAGAPSAGVVVGPAARVLVHAARPSTISEVASGLRWFRCPGIVALPGRAGVRPAQCLASARPPV